MRSSEPGFCVLVLAMMFRFAQRPGGRVAELGRSASGSR